MEGAFEKQEGCRQDWRGLSEADRPWTMLGLAEQSVGFGHKVFSGKVTPVHIFKSRLWLLHENGL